METNIAPEAMVVTPHHLATQSAISILKEGGTAIEAMVAAAATVSVVYPHMNHIGGDSFWLIIPPNGEPVVIEACGAAGSLATPAFYEDLTRIPDKGPKAACTVAGTVGGWEEALKYNTECGYQRRSTHRLLSDAIRYAENGFPVTKSQVNLLKTVDRDVSEDFNKVFIPNGNIPKAGEKFCQKQLASTFRKLAENGLTGFYKGDLAKLIVEDMETLGMPITEADLANYAPVRKVPIRLLHTQGEIFNCPPPTQGLVSLALLGILDKLGIDGKNEVEFVHAAVEATKVAFEMRDKYITDPDFMEIYPELLITSEKLLEYANQINLDQASAVGKGRGPGDTIWMGIIDNKGFSVSFIQSIYFPFGSGVLLPKTGILWHNRGVAFTLDQDHILSIKPGKKPFHTLNPSAARLKDGRVMVYGTRGGDGQSQTQAAVFHRYVVQGMELQASVTAPRWLYGRIAGNRDDTLKLEGRFCNETVEYLKNKGHDIVMVPDVSDIMGEAGAVVRRTDGMIEGAFDVRSNGSAAGF